MPLENFVTHFQAHPLHFIHVFVIHLLHIPRAYENNLRFLVTFGCNFLSFSCAITPYNRKHHPYGRKVEASVNPRGFTINCTKFAKESVADIQVFRHNLDFHKKMRIETEKDLALEDRGRRDVQLSQEGALSG